MMGNPRAQGQEAGQPALGPSPDHPRRLPLVLKTQLQQCPPCSSHPGLTWQESFPPWGTPAQTMPEVMAPG